MNSSIWILLIAVVFNLSSCNVSSNGIKKLSNGTYTGSSKASYTSESYLGTATIIVEKHKIVNVTFQIVDTLKKEVFNDEYENHFAGNQLYIEQCRNDRAGVIRYPKELLEKQNIDSVDAVSGATWSYNIFKASVEKALKK